MRCDGLAILDGEFKKPNEYFCPSGLCFVSIAVLKLAEAFSPRLTKEKIPLCVLFTVHGELQQGGRYSAMGRSLVVMLSLQLVFQLGLSGQLQASPDYDLAPVLYSASKDDNTITRIQAAMDAQTFNLSGSSSAEVLRSLLDELGISVSSQVLVFSKTSLQRKMITPTNPRAIYFNSDFYVGYVPGGLIEIVACDDPKGMMFYSLDVNAEPEKRRFLRSQECMSCHANKNTMNVPGLLVRSVFTEQDGQPLLSWGSLLTTPGSPVEDRWGGWYVTGRQGQTRHMGNQWVSNRDAGRDGYEATTGQNVTDLNVFFDTNKHLADTSDILALMIMEHQIHAHNTLSAAKVSYLRSAYLNKAIHHGKYDVSSPSAQKMIVATADSILKMLLFADEVELPEDGIDGSDLYRDSFIGQGLSHDGHSLRDLRLERRLFKYRCSFMIHSKSFEQLPEEIKTCVLEKLHAIVTGEDDMPGFPSLSSREKERIHGILSHTHAAYQRVVSR